MTMCTLALLVKAPHTENMGSTRLWNGTCYTYMSCSKDRFKVQSVDTERTANENKEFKTVHEITRKIRIGVHK